MKRITLLVLSTFFCVCSFAAITHGSKEGVGGQEEASVPALVRFKAYATIWTAPVIDYRYWDTAQNKWVAFASVGAMRKVSVIDNSPYVIWEYDIDQDAYTLAERANAELQIRIGQGNRVLSTQYVTAPTYNDSVLYTASNIPAQTVTENNTNYTMGYLYKMTWNDPDFHKYYASLEGKSGYELRRAVTDIIGDPSVISYGALRSAYKLTDVRSDGSMWDMYSNCGGTYYDPAGESGGVEECSAGYNREHSLPKSWWKHVDTAPLKMYSDIVHVIPTNSTVNSARGAYPYSEIANPTTTYGNGSKAGNSSYPGYTNSAFDPADAYKGDLARIYFYMTICYPKANYTQSTFTTSAGSIIFTFDTINDFTAMGRSLLMKWHRNDVVSDKEHIRNDGVQSFQGNRNPFVDIPQLAEYFWGKKQGKPFYFDPSKEPVEPEQPCADIDYSEAFTNTFGKFNILNMVGTKTWINDATYGAKINGNGTNVESWLISPMFNFSKKKNAVITFEQAINYCSNADALKTNHTLWISKDYDYNPAEATWEPLTFSAMPTGTSWTFKANTINIPQSYLTDSIHIAFKYLSTTTLASVWEIRKFVLKAECSESAVEEHYDNVTCIFTDNNGIVIQKLQPATIAVYDLLGRCCFHSSKNYESTVHIPVDAGIYCVRIDNTTYKVIK